MSFGAFARRGFGGVPWAWIWDPSVAETLTLSGSSPQRVDRINSLISGAAGWDALKDGANTSLEYVPSWRNGQAAVLAGPGYCNATGAIGPSAPYTLVYVAEFVPSTGDEFRILTTGIGAIDGPQPTPFYVQSSTMRTFAGSSVALGSATAYWGVPFIAFATVNGSSYRVALYPHGMPAVTFSGAGNPGTNRFQGARLGKGETAGFWNAPIGWIGGAQGALTAEVEAQLYGQFSARFNIVVSP